eukprot:307175-Hanusia_phi.AAC.3
MDTAKRGSGRRVCPPQLMPPCSTEISLNSSASRRLDESVQAFGGVCDLLFYGDDLPILFALLEVISGLHGDAPVGSMPRCVSCCDRTWQRRANVAGSGAGLSSQRADRIPASELCREVVDPRLCQGQGIAQK